MSSKQNYVQLNNSPPGVVLASRNSQHEALNEQKSYGFDQGTVPFTKPDESLLYDQSLTLEHGCERPCLKYPAHCIAGISVVGCCWVASKTNIIRQDEIGIVTQMDGGVHLLTPGCHSSGCCTNIKRFKVRSDLINHGNMHIVRIPAGNYGKAWRNGVAEILLPGRHVINDPLFEFVATVPINDPVIRHGTVSILTIAGNQIGRCIVNGKGFWLFPGRHFINNAQFDFVGSVDRAAECIVVGSKARITVPSGKIGLAWEKGEPLILEHGTVIERDSPFFKYDGSVDMTRSLIVHGSIKFCSVRQGLFGVSYNEGRLEILNPGRHILTKPTHFLAGFLPSGQQTLSIESVTSMSSDNVGIKFDAALTIQVVDATKAVTMLGIASKTAASKKGGSAKISGATSEQFDLSSFYWNIIQQAKLALSIIIGNNKLNASFKSTSKSTPVVVAHTVDGGEAKRSNPEENEEEEGSFKQHIHDLFMLKFSENMSGSNGVNIIDMSIEDIIITNPELAKAMSQAAVSATKLSSARIEVEEKRMRAQGKARSMQILASAEADRIRTLDDAMSKISTITQQRELIRSTGDAIEKSRSTVMLGNSFVDVTRMLGNMTADAAK
jgi:regulator of protease activity HflC (stomatin/prohibitin superfamily)